MNTLHCLDDVLQALQLTEHRRSVCQLENFPIKIPLSYLSLMEKGKPRDPLLLQVLPSNAELRPAGIGFSRDPVGDLAAVRVPGVLHKYQGRVLLLVTGACAIHCRYCFRRHFPYRQHTHPHQLRQAIDYIKQDHSIEEVILSGGDPLSLSNEKLFDLGERLEAIAHVQRLRIHSRTLVVVPQRLDQPLRNWLSHRPKPYTLVLHINHPREISPMFQQAIHPLRHLTLLNQAVLLAGVNDDSKVLAELSRACHNAGILPYYLNLLDKTEGTEHFEVSAEKARAIMQCLRASLPGYLVPRLVREEVGAGAKTVVM